MSSLSETEPKRTGGGLNGLSQHREFLLDFMDPDFGVLDKLLSSRALTSRQVGRIKARTTIDGKNEELLEYIAHGHKFDELFVCLRASKQEHVVKYLEENGDYKVEYGGCWPLTDDEIRVLDINQECLVDLIEPGELVPMMFSREVLNHRQMDHIISKATNHERNEALLDIMRRRSRTDFLETIECLKETNQSHIAEILETKAVVACLHANLGDTVVDIAQAEDDISTRIASLLKDKTSEESKVIMDSILRLVDAKIIGANVGQSVVLYFLCRKTQELSQLRGIWTTGLLTRLTEEMFNRLLSTTPKFNVTVKWKEKEYRETKAYLEEFEKHSQSIASHQIHILDLPFELQDMILERVCLLQLASQHRSDREVFISVAQIVFCWFQRLRKRKFVSRLFRRLSANHRSLRKTTLIIRNNEDCLVEIIQLKSLLHRMRKSDCFTDQQFRSINRQSGGTNDLLHAVRSFDGQRFSAFVECLRQTFQVTAADILESGGVIVKATIRNEPVKNQLLLEQRLVEKVQQIRQCSCPITRDTESILKRLKSQGTELLSAIHDRAIVLWTACLSPDVSLRTDDGLTRFLKDISDIFRSLASSDDISLSALEPRDASIDCSSFEKDFVTCKTSVTFTGTLQLKAEYFYGITTLHNHIYVLCQSPNSLNVFLDQHPFNLISVDPIEGIKKPEDIGSSTKDACLYITDSSKKCLWRKSKDELTVWLSDVDWPFTVSVLRDGRVLLPRKGQPSAVELYSRLGTLVQRIQLPGDIIDPLHGVQTRRGSLVISHWWRDSVTEGVFEVNRHGQVVRHFLASGTDQHLTYPRYLALDSADRIFVTDFDYNRVIQLDPDLGWIRTLLTKEDNSIEYPERLCYSANRSQLLVGHSGGVDVFTLKSK